jgi:hypothetical protein
MPFTDGDFIDGQAFELFELGTGKTLFQISFLDVFDYIPTDSQMSGDIQNRHVPTQLQRISLKGLGVSEARICKTQMDLPDQIAGPAPDTLDGQSNPDRLKANGQGAKPTLNRAFKDYMTGSANRTSQILSFLTDCKDHFAALIASTNIFIAMNTETMIQKTGGHDRLPSELMFGQTPMKET